MNRQMPSPSFHSIKLERSIYINKIEETYVTDEKYIITREEENVFTIEHKATKDKVYTSLSNVVYWK